MCNKFTYGIQLYMELNSFLFAAEKLYKHNPMNKNIPNIFNKQSNANWPLFNDK